MAATYKSKYTGEEIDALLDKASTSIQSDDIQEFEDKKHSHDNLSILDKFTEINGELYYNGHKVSFVVETPEPES